MEKKFDDLSDLESRVDDLESRMDDLERDTERRFEELEEKIRELDWVKKVTENDGLKDFPSSPSNILTFDKS